ncbi:YciI family protein [Tunturibacter psychrotolerans]|uniref:YciI family protein n=1 Tax=Tunturiibacter psychrotolerans TaxID=3069686 RepID=A0AAU7ZWC0_9BACT
MRFMVIVKATPESEKEGALPDPQLLLEMGKYNEELSKAGVLLALDGLHPSSKGARVKFSGKSRTVVDGPFTEAKELIAGFSILQVKSLEEAIEWVKRAPNCNPGSDSEVEIRQIFEMEDLASVLSEEQIQHKVAKRAELPNQTANK